MPKLIFQMQICFFPQHLENTSDWSLGTVYHNFMEDIYSSTDNYWDSKLL
jgi:hypothetical protein